MVRKPGKILLDNTNLLHAIHGALRFDSDVGAIRKTFFANQIAAGGLSIALHQSANFLIDSKYVVEVGGPNKGAEQLRSHKQAYLAVEGIEVGFGYKIPLFLFGFLY